MLFYTHTHTHTHTHNDKNKYVAQSFSMRKPIFV
jgi:hypothetical protein